MQVRFIQGTVLAGLLLMASCQSANKPTSIKVGKTEMAAMWDSNPDRKTAGIFASYKATVDSIMTPVIGKCAVDMVAKRPESLLPSLIADVLRESTVSHIGRPADLAVINMGGLRSSLNSGNITYGNIYEILPFENSLCIVSLQGKVVKELMSDIAKVGGEGISNVQMVISKDRELIDAKIGGLPIDDERMYEIATVDFLAEGNDKMYAFKKAEKKICVEEATLRNIFVEYVKSLTAKGQEVTAPTDGRITVK